MKKRWKKFERKKTESRLSSIPNSSDTKNLPLKRYRNQNDNLFADERRERGQKNETKRKTKEKKRRFDHLCGILGSWAAGRQWISIVISKKHVCVWIKWTTIYLPAILLNQLQKLHEQHEFHELHKPHKHQLYQCIIILYTDMLSTQKLSTQINLIQNFAYTHRLSLNFRASRFFPSKSHRKKTGREWKKSKRKEKKIRPF